ncbi:MAG: GNAT family N-acetyltransferase [Oscillospiraceae bacterium]|nr:GNAT family N-acetyltransferase [Oscillospiraceae bacterium]
MGKYKIRPIEPQDDRAVERVIRDCLREFGADHAGTAWADPDLCRLSQVYDTPDSCYWVALDGSETVVGGVGIGPLHGVANVCELQKLYCIPSVRGTGAAHQLMEEAIAFARSRYRACYLETLSDMHAARRFYEKYGFRRIDRPLGNTGHYNCDVRYLLPFPE